jgi:hypothetical protein
MKVRDPVNEELKDSGQRLLSKLRCLNKQERKAEQESRKVRAKSWVKLLQMGMACELFVPKEQLEEHTGYQFFKALSGKVITAYAAASEDRGLTIFRGAYTGLDSSCNEKPDEADFSTILYNIASTHYGCHDEDSFSKVASARSGSEEVGLPALGMVF